MKIRAFQINSTPGAETYQNLLHSLNSKPLENRDRELVVGGRIRLENYRRTRQGLELNFVKWFEGHGPGKVAPGKAMVGFDFDPNESLGEDTAMFIPSGKNVALVQYNHKGAKAETIGEYLSSFTTGEDEGFEFLWMLEPEVERQIRESKAVKKFTFKVDTRHFSNRDREMGISLTEALNLGTDSGGESVEITISAGPGKQQALFADTRKKLLKMMNFARLNPEKLTKLHASLQPPSGGRTQALNLLGAGLSWEVDIPQGADKRFPLDDRMKALRSCSRKL